LQLHGGNALFAIGYNRHGDVPGHRELRVLHRGAAAQGRPEGAVRGIATVPWP
jgi:hypothetical protein